MPIRKRSKDAKSQEVDGFVFSRYMLPNTTVQREKDGTFRQFSTMMPTGVAQGWTNCGFCGLWADNCTCPEIIHPSSIEWCWIRFTMRSENSPLASERLVRDHPEVTSRGVFFYAAKRPATYANTIVSDESVNRPKKPRPAEPIPGPITKRGKVVMKPRKKIKSRAETDRDRFDEQAADVMAKDRKRVLKRVTEAPEPKRIRKVKR